MKEHTSSALALQELFKNPPLNQAKLIAGLGGISNTIGRFGILEAPDSVDFVKPNEFLISTGYIFKDANNSQLEIIQKLKEVGASGLGVKFSRYIRKLDDSVIKYANENNFPIFELPADSTWYEICAVLIPSFPTSANNTDLPTAHEFEEILEILPNLSTPYDIVKQISTHIHYPCGLVDLGRSINICHPYSFIQKDKFAHYLENEARTNLSGSHVFRIQPKETGSFVVVTIDTQKQNYLVILEQQPLSGDFITLLKFLSFALNAKLNDLFSNSQMHIAASNKFLLELCASDQFTSEEVHAQATQLGIDLTFPCVFCWCKINYLPQTLEQEKNNYILNIAAYLQELNIKMPVLCGFQDVYHLFFLVSASEEQDYSTTISSLLQQLTKKYDFLGVNMGVSSICASHSDMKRAYQEATAACKIGIKVSPESQVFYATDLSIYNILDSADFLEKVKQSIKKYIDPLILVDRKTSNQLLQTLKVYFDSNRGIRKCATSMYVHHNTIRYRLNQIEKITGLNLDNPNDLFLLELCLKCMPLL